MERPGIGPAIRAAREARGITLRALAAAIEVSPATVSAFERHLVPITVARLEQVAAALNVAVVELLAAPSTDGHLLQPESRGAGLDSHPDPRSNRWREYVDLEMDPVLLAATRLFVAHGFHATTVREVAAEAGMSVAGVYHHYPSKEQILVALLDYTMGEIGWRLDAAQAEGRNAVESLALMVEALALFHAIRGDLAFLGASEMRGLASEPRTRITALRDNVQHALDRQAQAAVDARLLPPTAPDDVRVGTRAIATMCTALPSWFRPDGPISAREVASRYSDYALVILGRSAAS